jgi:diguanylate cyclase (GGDEF)-like protein/putative nucleotidyltransferase with HDIG domain
MYGIKNNRKKQIVEMISIVKVLSLMLTSIAFFQCFFKEDRFYQDLYSQAIASITFSIMIILILIYMVWTVSYKKNSNKKIFKVASYIENFIFISIFFIAILVSGANESEIKVLFLFIIISSTLESGMNTGVVIASIASFLILGMDLILVRNVNVNEYFQNDLILAGVFILTAWPLGFYVKVEGEHIEKLEELVNKDGLTKLFNHRYFHEKLKNEIEIATKKNEKVSMIFFDIDYFKNYNDLYGHQEGDKVLRRIGKIVNEVVRENDIAARYGGEEFSIIMPNTGEEEAMKVADTLRRVIEEEKFYGEENQPNGRITVSLGVSIYPDKAKSELELIKSSDDALYRAKFFNKNRVESYISVLEELEKEIDDEDNELITSIKTLISVINAKDRYTYGHSERVVLYSKLIACKLGLNKKDKDTLIYGAYIHDIGKVNVPKEILIKKMPLTNEEWETLKDHSASGVEIIKPVKSLQDTIPIILNHHERYDGKGYPCKLKGEEIPYLARVLCVVDSFDAMTSNRPYNKRKTCEEAIIELRKCSGTQFDPFIVEKFIEIIKESSNKFDKFL